MSAYLKILVGIAVYYIILIIGLSLLFTDTALTSPQYPEQPDFHNNLSSQQYNLSHYDVGEYESSGLGAFLNALKVMFTFSTPVTVGMPYIFVFFISFVNWILLIITGVCIYRLANPFA